MEVIFQNLNKLAETMPLKAWQVSSDNILLHTRGKGLEALLKDARPNEPEDIIKYRLKHLYKYTRTPFSKAIDAMTKSVDGVGLTYDVQDDAKEVLNSTKIKTTLGDYDLQNYLISIFQQVIEYPNAHLVWLPINPNYNYNYNPINHPLGLEGNTSIKLSYEPFIATKVIYFDNDSLVWEHGKWSFLDKQGAKVEAPYFMGLDLTGYYRSIPTGYNSKGQINYTIEDYYTPNGGFKLRHSRPLGGDLSSVEHKGVEKPYYESYFANAAEFGRDFITSYSDTKGLIIKNMHPIRVFNDALCGTCSGKGTTGLKQDITCNDCQGSGHTFTLSPYGDVQKKASGRRNEETSTTPFVEYYSSGEGIMQFNIDYCFNTLLPMVGDALCLNYVRTAQSGKAKEEDKESYYALMSKLISNYQELLQFSLECIIDLVIYDKSKREKVEVYTQRSVRSANTFDLINEIGTLTSSALPSSMKSAITKQYLSDIKSDFERKILEVIVDYDVLFGKTEADILQLSAAVNSAVTNEDMKFNLKGRSALTKLSDKYGDSFLTISNEALYNEAISML